MGDWEVHLKRCNDEAEKDAAWRRALNKDYAEQLRHQMQQAEERKADARYHQVEQASAHDLPNFAEAAAGTVHEYIHERRKELREDLDSQVDLKRRMKEAAKQRELEMDLAHISAGHREMAMLKME